MLPNHQIIAAKKKNEVYKFEIDVNVPHAFTFAAFGWWINAVPSKWFLNSVKWVNHIVYDDNEGSLVRICIILEM